MQIIDFNRLLDASSAEKMVPQWAAPAAGVYQGRDGVQFRSEGIRGELVQEIVRFSDRALLFASDYSPRGEQLHSQVVNDSDWVHIQFRLNGGGREHVSEAGVIETPEKSCIIARYPKNSIIERKIDETSSWRVACLLISPRGLTDLLDVPASKLPECVAWMTLEDQLELRSRVLPLQSPMAIAVNDILSCPFSGGNRRAYMRAKSLELLSTVIHALDTAARGVSRSALKLSHADMTKIALARRIMMDDLERTLTLAELARRVGLNRTKFALGFKQIYALSVQAYWRDAKLSRARELLAADGARVTEVALSMGYSELSSFTRAFSRKFGVLPRNYKTQRG